jgi:hypothetical protein
MQSVTSSLTVTVTADAVQTCHATQSQTNLWHADASYQSW